MRGKNTLFSAAIILLVLGSSVFAYQQVIDLGILGSYQYSKATSINDNGQVVGYAYADTQDTSGIRRACLFDSTGGGANTYLGTIGGTKSCAYSINNNGKIVGYAADSYDTAYACLFDSTGGGNNKNLGDLGGFPGPGGSNGSAYCINNNGYIVGQALKTVLSGGIFLSSLHACYFDQTMPWSNYDLGTLGASPSLAYSINNDYKIVGYSQSMSGGRTAGYHACLFGTNNIDLGTLGGRESVAYSTNDSGLIAGSADYNYSYPRDHACIFDPSGSGDNIDLGTLGGLISAALFVNNENQIVGYATDSSGQRKACLFDSTGNGNNINLNTLIDPSSGWILKEASCINNNGWIVGYGTYNGIDQAFLLTPEPASALIMAVGAAIAASRRRRR